MTECSTFIYFQIIRLEFLRFDTEECCDEVDVYDGSSSSAALLATCSGNNLLGDMFSDSPLFIHFHTDASVTKNGFKIRYYTQDNKRGKGYLVALQYMYVEHVE